MQLKRIIIFIQLFNRIYQATGHGLLMNPTILFCSRLDNYLSFRLKCIKNVFFLRKTIMWGLRGLFYLFDKDFILCRSLKVTTMKTLQGKFVLRTTTTTTLEEDKRQRYHIKIYSYSSDFNLDEWSMFISVWGHHPGLVAGVVCVTLHSAPPDEL